MRELIELIYVLLAIIVLIAWISGVVIAKGFVSASVAIIFPFWAWYLVIERLMIMYWVLG